MSNNLLENDIDLDYVRIHYDPEGILEFHYKKDVEITMDMVQEMMVFGNDLHEKIGKKYGVISIMENGVTVSAEVREFGSTKEANQNNYASSAVMNSLAHKLIGNFMIRVQKPIVPFKLFTSIEDARQWLLKIQKETGSD